MIKTFIVDKTDVNMRIDRLLRSKLGKIPQSLIEKSLRNGKIRLNKKKVKSSYKVNSNDKIELFNFYFKEEIIQKKIKFKPSDEIIKSNEDLVIDNNDDFIVLNKSAGISVQVAKELFDCGVMAVDVAGFGGTNWARIEAARRDYDTSLFIPFLGEQAE